MKTFCKRHEVFYDAAGTCADCAAMPAKTEPAKNMSLVITEGSPLDGLTVDPCKCGSVSLAGPGEDPIVRRDVWNHSRNHCWIPAAFPFDPLPPMDSPEGKAEMERALGKTLISKDNALVRYVREAQERNELRFKQTLKGMFPPEEQLEIEAQQQRDMCQAPRGLDAWLPPAGETYPQWKSAPFVDEAYTLEQAMIDAGALMAREGRKPDFFGDFKPWALVMPAGLVPDFKALVDPSPKLLAGMAKVEPLHDPATCKICRTINEQPAPQQQKLTHDWDLNRDVCRRCRKTGTAIVAVPAFKYCVETPEPPPPPVVAVRWELHPATFSALMRAQLRLPRVVELIQEGDREGVVLRSGTDIVHVFPRRNAGQELGTVDRLVSAVLALGETLGV